MIANFHLLMYSNALLFILLTFFKRLIDAGGDLHSRWQIRSSTAAFFVQIGEIRLPPPQRARGWRERFRPNADRDGDNRIPGAWRSSRPGSLVKTATRSTPRRSPISVGDCFTSGERPPERTCRARIAPEARPGGAPSGFGCICWTDYHHSNGNSRGQCFGVSRPAARASDANCAGHLRALPKISGVSRRRSRGVFDMTTKAPDLGASCFGETYACLSRQSQ